jgi:hypothetical protein
MTLSTLDLLATVFRLAMVLVYGYIWFFFWKRYNESKKAGFTNSFFLGFVIIFALLLLFSLFYGVYEFWWWSLSDTSNAFDFTQQFSWVPEKSVLEATYPPLVVALAYQYRPLYLSFYFILNVVMASLVFPLEQAVRWTKTPFTKFMILCGAMVFLNFIPAIALSYVGAIITILAFTGVSFGLILNILVNIKLFKDATGAIRTRSLYAIIAFLLLGVGLWASMEVGFARMFIENASYRYDIIFGSIFQAIAVIFYRMGFGKEV